MSVTFRYANEEWRVPVSQLQQVDVAALRQTLSIRFRLAANSFGFKSTDDQPILPLMDSLISARTVIITPLPGAYFVVLARSCGLNRVLLFASRVAIDFILAIFALRRSGETQSGGAHGRGERRVQLFQLILSTGSHFSQQASSA